MLSGFDPALFLGLSKSRHAALRKTIPLRSVALNECGESVWTCLTVAGLTVVRQISPGSDVNPDIVKPAVISML